MGTRGEIQVIGRNGSVAWITLDYEARRATVEPAIRKTRSWSERQVQEPTAEEAAKEILRHYGHSGSIDTKSQFGGAEDPFREYAATVRFQRERHNDLRGTGRRRVGWVPVWEEQPVYGDEPPG